MNRAQAQKLLKENNCFHSLRKISGCDIIKASDVQTMTDI